MSGPKILKEEIRAAINKMKNGKASGPDNISTEMIKLAMDFSVDKLTDIANHIYDTGNIPEDLSKSIFVALPKKAGTDECEMHRTISLMSVIVKIILRVLMLRKRNKTRPEISEAQCCTISKTLQKRLEAVEMWFY